jgi:hypothetical protein
MSSNFKAGYEWVPGAMYPAELQWLKLWLESQKVEILIECGRQDGASAKWFDDNVPDISIFSIDLDDRPDVLANSMRNLTGTNVNAVTGDIFLEVPRLIRANPSKRIAIVEDAVKGWPGLALLMSCIFYENVVLIAQHNSHIGHKSREFWLKISDGKAFLESHDDELMSNSLNDWVSKNGDLLTNANRQTDHSSLALTAITAEKRMTLLDSILESRKEFGLWDPVQFRTMHSGGIDGFVSRNWQKERVFPWVRKQR